MDAHPAPQQETLVEELIQTLRPRLDRLLRDAAAQLAANRDKPFGANEFALRDLVHQAAADLLEASLAEKKTATSAPR